MANDTTLLPPPPQWNSKPMYHLPSWGEPLIVLTILCTAMFFTRRRDLSILGRSISTYDSYLDSGSADSSDDLLLQDSTSDDDEEPLYVNTSKPQSKRRRCCCCIIYTPNSSRFANHIHSRILAKFPFLIEMFYWIITYLFYRFTKVMSSAIFTTKVIDVARDHGLAVLAFEEFSIFSFLFPVKEIDVQMWFMNGHQDALTFLNRAYALIHIPGTVGFIAWYYYIAPSHPTFATIRRTLTLTNWLAFFTFTVYPCMPPRLLPPEYGFLDSVRHDEATSIWMSGNFVNSLAAMPSMHFGYAFVIGCTMIYHSGIFRRNLEKGESRKGWGWRLIYVLIALGYPALVLSAIVATANHYWMDALMATIVAAVALACNRVFLVFLPFEDVLLWALRLDKPAPTTGVRFRQRGGKI